MPFDKTKLKFELFDRQRKRAGLGDELELIQYSPTTGYGTVTTISEGWAAEKIIDNLLKQEFFEVKIAQNGEDLAELFSNRPTHLKIGDYYYKLTGVDQPKGERGVWSIRCAPTGEKVAS